MLCESAIIPSPTVKDHQHPHNEMSVTPLINNQSKQAYALDEVGSGKGQDFPSRRNGNAGCSLEDGGNMPDDKYTSLQSLWFETTKHDVRNCVWKIEISDSQECS
jgi:hypothetical protein